MEIRLTLTPGQPGTKRLVGQYGDRLVCVRYRYDDLRRKRYKTVELIVEEVSLEPLDDTLVYIKVAWGETEVGRSVRKAGGEWDATKQVWTLTYGQVKQLGLVDRIIDPKTK
ncbi:MAG: hypothetical protein R3E79_35345 [Caldilineaceae bacterium]